MDVFGKGMGESINKIFYLPEAHTDMIFAVIGEELGLIGAAGVIAAFAAFCWAVFASPSAAQIASISLLATGLTVLVSTQAATNLAAVLGPGSPSRASRCPSCRTEGQSLIVALAGGQASCSVPR